MGRTLKYYPSSGFLPSVVSAAFFGKTCNELISCDSGALAAHPKSKTPRAVRMSTIPWGSSFTMHHYHTTLTRNSTYCLFCKISGHLRPLNHCPEWDVRQVLPIQGNFFIEATSNHLFCKTHKSLLLFIGTKLAPL